MGKSFLTFPVIAKIWVKLPLLEVLKNSIAQTWFSWSKAKIQTTLKTEKKKNQAYNLILAIFRKWQDNNNNHNRGIY